MHRGKRNDNGDYFDDLFQTSGVGGSGGNAGILEGAGLDDYDGVKEEIQQDGLRVDSNCRFCNRRQGIVLEWPELYFVGANQPGVPPLMPRGWLYSPNNGSAVLIQRCPGCAQPQGYAIHVTPQEAQRYISSAVGSGLLSPAAVAQFKQHVQQARAQFGG